MDLEHTRSEIESTRETLTILLDMEQDSSKIQMITDMNNSLQDSTGKLTFTQYQINDNLIREYDEFMDPSEEIIYDAMDNDMWEVNTIENISRTCKKLRESDTSPTCLCTHMDTREIEMC